MMYSLKSLLKTNLTTVFGKEFTLDQIIEALDHYRKNMSEGKVLIKPNKAINKTITEGKIKK